MSDFAFVGSVTRVVGGWETLSHRAASVTALQVLEILRNPHGVLVTGETRRHIEPVGNVLIRGEVFCTEDPAAYFPQEADRVLVYGFRDPRGRKDLVFGGEVLRIRGETVILPKGLGEPINLRELRASAKSGR